MKCVVNFAFTSGQQSQTELRLYFGVCALQKFQHIRRSVSGGALPPGMFVKQLAAEWVRGLRREWKTTKQGGFSAGKKKKPHETDG